MGVTWGILEVTSCQCQGHVLCKAHVGTQGRSFFARFGADWFASCKIMLCPLDISEGINRVSASKKGKERHLINKVSVDEMKRSPRIRATKFTCALYMRKKSMIILPLQTHTHEQSLQNQISLNCSFDCEQNCFLTNPINLPTSVIFSPLFLVHLGSIKQSPTVCQRAQSRQQYAWLNRGFRAKRC